MIVVDIIVNVDDYDGVGIASDLYCCDVTALYVDLLYLQSINLCIY